jgi:hypothetical protein
MGKVGVAGFEEAHDTFHVAHRAIMMIGDDIIDFIE